MQENRGPTSRSLLTLQLKVHLLFLLLQSAQIDFVHLSIFICSYLVLLLLTTETAGLSFEPAPADLYSSESPYGTSVVVPEENSAHQVERVFVTSVLCVCVSEWRAADSSGCSNGGGSGDASVRSVCSSSGDFCLAVGHLPPHALSKLCSTCRKHRLHQWTSAARG